MAAISRLAAGSAVVVVSMVALFALPREYFVVMTFVSTTCMLAAALALGLRAPAQLRYAAVAVGLASAALLYLVFLLGGVAVDTLNPFGMTSASETSIYSLIASPSNPLYLQVGLLLFDSAGFESFFRGVVQERLQKRMGVGAAPVVALLDASIHVVTLNPLWVGATFATDLVWGVTYFYGRGLQASFASHFIWDLAIFIVRPIV
ncbi:MAG: CPBP family glutamic-type intramembrane protease [Thaumarchaeota archaeon]|nr:CPBP family glutamic-type intramembrane protease [Nitrososphaerota archaeon]